MSVLLAMKSELQKKVEKACGWEPFERERGDGQMEVRYRFNGEFTLNYPPNYVESLDAMGEAEKTLSDEQIGTYINHLRVIAGGKPPTNYGWLSIKDSWILATASAEARATAFTLTISK